MKRKLHLEQAATATCLQPIDLSDSLLEEGRKIFDRLSPPLVYPESVEVLPQSYPARDVYFINQGVIKNVYMDHEGRENIIDLRFAGCMLGAVSVIVHKPYAIAAITLTRCHLYRIPANEFTQLIESDVRFTHYIMQVISHQAEKQLSHLIKLQCFPARQRLEMLLLQLASMFGNTGSRQDILMDLPLKHREIAQLIAVTPEHLSRTLKHMEHEGLIRRQRHLICIPDVAKLYNPNCS